MSRLQTTGHAAERVLDTSSQRAHACRSRATTVPAGPTIWARRRVSWPLPQVASTTRSPGCTASCQKRCAACVRRRPKVSCGAAGMLPAPGWLCGAHAAVYIRGPRASSLVLLADEELGEALRGSKVRGLSNVPEEACTVPKVCWRAPIRATAPPLTPKLVAGEVRPHELCWVTVWQV